MDARFSIETLRATPNPQQAMWLAMHQDYSEDFVSDRLSRCPNETRSGELVISRCLKFGHWGVAEHPTIILNVGHFPHDTVMQLRTHRLASFDVQSGRYTSQRIIDVTNGTRQLEEVFYFRPVGKYTNRQGAKYEYTDLARERDMAYSYQAAVYYRDKIEAGQSEEHARSTIPFNLRQHFVLSCNARALMHFLDLRWKADAQLEAQWFSELLFKEFRKWMPEIADWYLEQRGKKARLAP